MTTDETGARCDDILTDEDVRYLLGSISDALLNGSWMTNANVAFEALCAHLGVDRDTLPLDRERARDAFSRQFNLPPLTTEP